MTVGCKVYLVDGHELISLPSECSSVTRAAVPQTMAVKRANNPDQGMVLVPPVDHSLKVCRGLCDGNAMVRSEKDGE